MKNSYFRTPRVTRDAQFSGGQLEEPCSRFMWTAIGFLIGVLLGASL